MLYDYLILVLLILVFCFFSMMLMVNVMFHLFNSMRPEGTKEIRFMPKKVKKTKVDKEMEESKRRYDTIMRNLDVYDGTEIGQEEVK